MEMLSWMKKIDMRTDKLDLLHIIDSMHEAINAFVKENKEKDNIIKELRKELEKKCL